MAQSSHPDHTKDEKPAPAPAFREPDPPKFDGDLWLSDLLAVVEGLVAAVPSAHAMQARLDSMRARINEHRAPK